jgi:DNA polymerase
VSELSLDFETGSIVNLPAAGAYKYAQHPSTQVYMLGWAFDEEPVSVWTPDQPFPERICDHITEGGIITAWNAQFERLIMWYVLCPDFNVPEPALEQFHCTAARARAHGLPGKLDDCARAIGSGIQKQVEGTRLINTYSKNNVPFSGIPAGDLQLFEDYCALDVDVERGIAKCLRPLTEDEWYEYHVNEHVNDLGIPIDTQLVRQVAGMADTLRDQADRGVANLTHDQVTTTRQRSTRDEWLKHRLTPAQWELLKDGDKYSFAELNRNTLLALPDLNLEARQYFELVEAGGGATIRKYSTLNQRSIEGRMNGSLMFNGAGQTGRFSSTGMQMHNLSRASLEDAETIIDQINAGVTPDQPHKTLKQLVRSTVYNPDGLTWFDWSSIEGRVAPWLEGTELGEAKLQLYIDGLDPYIYNAAATYGIDYAAVDKHQRQAGKLQELALQFLGGVGALKLMGINYGLSISDDEGARLRDGWREANPWAPSFGFELDRATIKAVRNPRQWQSAGRVRYISDGGNWLWCELPSGRLLAYHKPALEEVETPWGDTRMAVTCVWGAAKPKVGEPWPRRSMHGGLWLENITQATAADILREAIVRVDDSGLDIVLHVHDEVIIEGYHLDKLKNLMLTLPSWAKGLPLEGEGGTGERYGK